MIERAYLDNIRSFVSFEWKPERLALLLGPNGAGKTSLFETLFALRGFVTGEKSVSEAFPDLSRTRWDTRSAQTIELDVRASGGLYRYRLVVEHDASGRNDPLVASESLSFDDRAMVEFKTGNLRVYRGAQAEAIPGTRPTRSGVGALDPSSNEFLGGFQDWMRDLWLLRPDPRAMSGRVDRRRVTKTPWLETNLSNFAAWYPPLFASKPGAMFKAMTALQQTLPGLVELRQTEGALEALFDHGGVTSTYSFDELSDGERALVALYVVLHAVAGPGKVLLLDEPDNYLGLREIQPWLAELTDRALRSVGPQVILISHHPEALNFLAPERGWRLWRDDNGPTRIEKFEVEGHLDPAEMIARGWDDRK